MTLQVKFKNYDSYIRFHAYRTELLDELERKYIVECFKVTGFETPIAISKLRVVGEKNSIKDMEEYIEKWYRIVQGQI